MSSGTELKKTKLSSETFLDELIEIRPADLEEMPNFEIYMDQLLAYIDHQLIKIDGDQGLTAAMVNNYIKQGLVSRSTGKRYTQKHIIELTLIQTLKSVLQIKELTVMREALRNADHSNVYELFREVLDVELNNCVKEYEELSRMDNWEQALNFAVKAYANLLCCRHIISRMEKEQNENKS